MSDNEKKNGNELLKELLNEAISKNVLFMLFIVENNLMADFMKYDQDKSKGLDFWNKQNEEGE